MKIFLLLILALTLSCSSDNKKGRTEAESLFKEAEDLMKADRFILATEKLNLIKTQHPYSFYATPAELLQADILFLQENYIEAAAAYLLFRDFHPKHEKIPYVVYRIAESYFKQIPDTIDRDLEPAVESIKYFDEVVQKYSDSSYRIQAQEGIEAAKKMLRQKDQYIADFYFKTYEFKAARYWYLDMIETYQEDPKLKNHAMVRTILATHELKEWDACMDYVEKYYESVDKEFHDEIKLVKEKCSKKQ
jgi:outer membrane protein assembly factor BamD